jgi:rubrerythrin
MTKKEKQFILKALVEMDSKINAIYMMMHEMADKNGFKKVGYNFENSVDNIIANHAIDRLLTKEFPDS